MFDPWSRLKRLNRLKSNGILRSLLSAMWTLTVDSRLSLKEFCLTVHVHHIDMEMEIGRCAYHIIGFTPGKI